MAVQARNGQGVMVRVMLSSSLYEARARSSFHPQPAHAAPLRCLRAPLPTLPIAARVYLHLRPATRRTRPLFLSSCFVIAKSIVHFESFNPALRPAVLYAVSSGKPDRQSTRWAGLRSEGLSATQRLAALTSPALTN